MIFDLDFILCFGFTFLNFIFEFCFYFFEFVWVLEFGAWNFHRLYQ